MTGKQRLDRVYHFIMETFVKRGYGPQYAEIATELGVAPEEGKNLLHELMGLGMAMWLAPGTDQIESFAPFNNVATQYRITVDGQQKWFAQ